MMCLFVGGATPMLAGQRRECRRQQISRHFGEAIPECRGGCDVCAEARSRDRPRRPQTRAKVGNTTRWILWVLDSYGIYIYSN